MKKSVYLSILGLLTLISCDLSAPKNGGSDDGTFVDEVVIKTTPVKNQGSSSLCWLYGMFATIESEHLMKGDSVNLSIDYPARMMLRDGAIRYFFSHNPDDVAMHGMSSRAIRLLQTYGAMPYDSYYSRQPVNYGVLSRKAQQIAHASVSLRQLDGHLENVFDENIGYLPKMVFMLGAEYAPLEFAHSVCLPGEYVSLTSFSHHPFGSKFVLEVPDNVSRDSFLNVPIDTLMHRTLQAIRFGHPVCWEGDISEPGFDFTKGIASLPTGVSHPDQRQRQRAFEAHRTTDDHVMELCGLARDKAGHQYFLAKNSWGTDNHYHGFMYLSYDYVKLKTIALYMSREAWASQW